MTQMNPKEAFHNTAYSVQLPYIPGLIYIIILQQQQKSIKHILIKKWHPVNQNLIKKNSKLI